MTEKFKFETPSWGAKLICLVYLIIAALLLITSYTYHQWSGNSPAAFKYFFLILGGVFLFVSLKPSNHKGWVYFSADNKGIHFSPNLWTKVEMGPLLVTWDKVGIIKREALYNNYMGLSIELAISQLEIDTYFNDVALTKKILGFSQKRNGFFVVAYSNNAFQKITNVISTLNQMKSENL